MCRVTALLLFMGLTIIAAVHAYWAFGGLWPAKDVQGLINTVIGDPRMTEMPSRELTLVVAALIFAAGVVALSAGGLWRLGWGWLARLGAGVLALIFLARGASGVTLGLGLWEAAISEPFATLDFQFYSPLCLLIGFGFVVLTVLGRPSATSSA